MAYTHDTFLSPFTWRYGSDAMRQIWSETHKRQLWRRIWVALASAQSQAGLVQPEQVEELRAQQDAVDIDRAHAIEAETRHDLMAEVHTYAEQCPTAGGIIHLGATSMDIEDNADALRLRESLVLIVGKLKSLLQVLGERSEAEADHICMAFTHLQPAEPTTLGYRLAGYAQDLLADYEALTAARDTVRGKGFKGAVGTAASYSELLAGTSLTPQGMESIIMEQLGLESFTIATQTYTRRQDWAILSALSGMGMTLYRIAFDLRLLQSPPFGEWGEPFGKSQVGSSAMPFKRNPINAENIDSLARHLAALPRVAWDNGAHNLLERTLDDSANRRVILPEAFLCADELLRRTQYIIEGLRLDTYAIQQNLATYGPFAATERLLMASVRAGGNRQVLHEVIREHSLAAWAELQAGRPNPLIDSLTADERLLALMPADQIYALLDAADYVGDAPQRARQLAVQVRERLRNDA